MFVVIDGIDGAGKGLQRELVTQLIREKYRIKLIDEEEFPVHNVFYNNVVHPALQKETTLNPSSWILSFLLDKTLQANRIQPYVKNRENLFIADGYLTTTIAYQSFLMKQVKLDKLLEYSMDFKIPEPDLAIFVDTDPEIAMQRKNLEEGHDEGLDMFEEDIAKQKKLQKTFRIMVKDQIYCKWEKVDGNPSAEEVTSAIISKLIKRKILTK